MSVGSVIFWILLLLSIFCMAVVCGVIRFTKTDGKLLNQYDERQKIEQGKGYRAGFMALTVLLLLYAVSYQRIDLPMDTDIMMVLFALLGGLITTAYCIWKDAWIPLNGKRIRMLMLNIPCALFLIIIGIEDICSGVAFTGKKLNLSSCPLFLGIFILAEYIMILLRQAVISQNEKEETYGDRG